MKKSLFILAICLQPATALASEHDQTDNMAGNTSDNSGHRASDGLSAIIVHGQKPLDQPSEIGSRLGLTVRETPALVDIVTQSDMQNQGLRTAIEALNSSAGVASGNLPGSIGSVSMRGFHRAVNYLYDGVRMPNSDTGMRNWDTWSFERIEVLKGPASVTAGEGALAGAINFVPRRPKTDKSEGEILASYGSFDTIRLAGDLNAPINEAVAVRTNMSWSRSSGWVDDTDSTSLAASASVLIQPTDRLSATLTAEYFEDTYSGAYFGTPIVSAAIAQRPSSIISSTTGQVLDKAMRRVNFDASENDVSSHTLWLRGRINYQLTEHMILTSDSSYYDGFRNWRNADEYKFNTVTHLIDRSATMITHDHQFWNQRVNLAFDGQIAGLRNRLSAGFEIGKTRFFTKRRFGSMASVDPFNPVSGHIAVDTATNFATRQDINADVNQFAFFAESAINFTEDWLLVSGIRYDSIKLDRTIHDKNSNIVQNYGQNYHPITWRIGSVYNLTEETQVFAQYTRAVTPVSGLLLISAANATFNLSKGASYEAGIKASLFDNRLALTASAFHIRQSDILTRDPDNPALVYQGGVQQSKGVELALNWTPTTELSLAFNGTLLDAKYNKLIEAGGLDRAGNRPTNVPEKLANFTVSYSPQNLPVTIAGHMRYNGGFYTSNSNAVKVNGFTVYDASIAWESKLGTFTLRGRNLTQKFYADWSGYAEGLVFIGAPRSVDLSFNRRF